MALLAALQELAHKQIKSVENLDADAMIALRLPDCVQVFSPASMGFPEPMNNEEFRRVTEENFPLFGNFKFTVHHIITDTESKKVVVRATGKSDTFVGPLVNEYVFILHATEDGTKLRMVEEFMDSLNITEWFGKLKAAKEAEGSTA